ncbi:MAG: NAD(P)H-dependent oxidoreductase [Candidatus Peribacteraceae bacterium]|nr:NAD(P)H-dependent oxidoreductase [Candidatus Peribacteraceae bacterium]
MTLIPAFEWRYATKSFDPTKKLSDADLQELLQALTLAPSSFGLQPWHFIVVTDPELRKKLQTHSWHQSQISEASHLVVLCALKNVTPEYIDGYIQHMSEVRGAPIEALAGLRDMLLNAVAGKGPAAASEWAARQVYIALGFLLAAAAEKGIDSTPMEGFDPKAYEQELGLTDSPWMPVLLCPLGYRAADDKHAAYKKVRFPAETLIEQR